MRTAMLFALAALAATGCFEIDDACDAPCEPPAVEACEGVCAPFVGGGWSHVLVAEDGAADCPDEAPFAALASDAPPLTACGAPPAPGACETPGFVCLSPALPPWAVCLVRDGEHACPEPYRGAVARTDDVTICCLPEP